MCLLNTFWILHIWIQLICYELNFSVLGLYPRKILNNEILPFFFPNFVPFLTKGTNYLSQIEFAFLVKDL